MSCEKSNYLVRDYDVILGGTLSGEKVFPHLELFSIFEHSDTDTPKETGLSSENHWRIEERESNRAGGPGIQVSVTLKEMSDISKRRHR